MAQSGSTPHTNAVLSMVPVKPGDTRLDWTKCVRPPGDTFAGQLLAMGSCKFLALSAE